MEDKKCPWNKNCCNQPDIDWFIVPCIETGDYVSVKRCNNCKKSCAVETCKH